MSDTDPVQIEMADTNDPEKGSSPTTKSASSSDSALLLKIVIAVLCITTMVLLVSTVVLAVRDDDVTLNPTFAVVTPGDGDNERIHGNQYVRRRQAGHWF